MPNITFDLTAEQKKDMKDMKTVRPIAVVKGNPKSKYYNKFLYLDQHESRSSNSNHLKIPEDSYFEILPHANEDTRDIYFLAGPSGCGKSTIATQIATNYHKMYPDRDVFVISHLDKDDTLDQMDFIKRLNLQKLYEQDPDVNDFADCMIIADDYEAVEGDVGKWIMNFLDQCMIMGRCHSKDEKEGRQGNISMILIRHQLSDYKKTRLLLMESSSLIFYPQSTAYHALQYVLKNQLGLEKDEVKSLRKMGRYVMASKVYPQYLLSAHEAKLLHQECD